MNIRNIVAQIARLLVGVLFIISGLIKLNDPIGFSYKLEEYFSTAVLNMPYLLPYALAIALIVVILEVVLGIMLLVGFKSKITIFSLLGLIVFFTFLTFYSAYFDKVKDCGCFGDALKLTPWESFTKDAILLLLILILAVNIRFIQPLFSNRIVAVISFIGLLLSCFMGYYVIEHLPIVDFRAFKVGANIQKGMEIPEGAPQSVYEMEFTYKVNGVPTVFSYDAVMAGKIPEGAEFDSRSEKLITEGYIPPIHDFTIEKEETNYTDSVLEEPKALFFVSYDLSKASRSGLEKLEKIHQEALKKGYLVIGLTASNDELIENTKKDFGLTFDYYFCDATTLKTVERANPSIIVLEKGTIIQKVHHNDADDLKL